MAGTVLYIFDESDWDTRIHTANAARKLGWDVTIGLLCEDAPSVNSDFKIHPLPRPKNKFGPLAALSLMRDLRNAIKTNQPDLVHIVTLKYSFILGLATLFMKDIKRVYTLAGLGYLFRGEGHKPVIIRTLLSPLFFLVFYAARPHLIFQNEDDQIMFTAMEFAEEQNTTLIRGSGVDTSKFAVQPLPKEARPVVLMPTRLVHNKGVKVFIEAAKIAAQEVNADFQIAGGETKHNPAAITKDEMEAMLEGSPVEWLGRVENMPELLSQSTLIVYPSYYGEAVPRVLLEAAAVGRPIITTDHPGCKEAIIHEKTGLLVPVKDETATAKAIVQMLQSRDMCEAMGTEARIYCEAEYDVKTVAQRTAAIYETL